MLERFEESRKERLLTIELVTDGVEVMMRVCVCVCMYVTIERGHQKSKGRKGG